jgi:hypothetical protein
VALCALTPARAAQAAAPAGTEGPGQARLSVVTFGPGDHTFSKFGHDALWLHDPRRPPAERDLVFNYGTFRFDSPWLIVDFLEGKLSYWLSVAPLSHTVAAYRAANRSVYVQDLALPAQTVREMADFLFDNARPENRAYRYDYYRDNCATRIRDVLDRHLSGRLRAASTGPARMTYREHTRRLTVDSPVLYLALDLAMGPVIDQPVTQWEAMFLPDRVQAKLAGLEDDAGVPLVSRSLVLFEADRPPGPEDPPGFGWGLLGIGIAVGALLAALGRVRGRAVQAVALGGMGVFVGILGTLLLVLWLLTDHDVTYWNRNVLLCPPWALAMPWLAVGFARARLRSQHLLMRVVSASAASAALAWLLAAFTVQSSAPALSLLVPAWWGAALGLWERSDRPGLALLLGRTGRRLRA